MIHYTKLPLSRYYDRITLTGLACTASNIRKVMDLFPGERVGVSLIALEEDSPIITWLEGQRWDLQIDRLHGKCDGECALGTAASRLGKGSSGNPGGNGFIPSHLFPGRENRRGMGR